MYPNRELKELARHKAIVRAKVTRSRTQCVEAVIRVAQPLTWIDQALLVWRQLSPLAQCAVAPLGLLLQRTVSRRLRFLRTMLRWGPLLLGTARLTVDFVHLESGRVHAAHVRG